MAQRPIDEQTKGDQNGMSEEEITEARADRVYQGWADERKSDVQKDLRNLGQRTPEEAVESARRFAESGDANLAVVQLEQTGLSVLEKRALLVRALENSIRNIETDPRYDEESRAAAIKQAKRSIWHLNGNDLPYPKELQ